MNKNWWPIIEMFYVWLEFKFLSPLTFIVQKVEFCFQMRAARLFKSKYWIHIEFAYRPLFANKYKSFLARWSSFASNIWFLL